MNGWSLVDGLWRNVGVGSMLHAQERRAFVAFDPASLNVHILPWADASGDYLKFSPILPFGTVVGVPFEIEAGWEYPCAGPLSKIQVVDLQLTQWGSYLRNFGAEGVKVIWWMGVDRITDSGDGYWRPKRSVVSGAPFSAHLQPYSDERNEDGTFCRPEWCQDSLAYYGAEGKQNNRLYADGEIKRAYHSGKIWHSPAPLAVFWGTNGQYLGKVQGRLEWDAEASCEVKAYPVAECMAFVAAGAVEVSIDATLGYTTVGGSTDGTRSMGSGVFAATEDGTVSSGSVYSTSIRSAQSHMALYADNAGQIDGATKIANTTILLAAQAVGWNNYLGMSGTVVSGNNYILFCGFINATNLTVSYDVGGSTDYYYFKTSVYNPPPDPMATGWLRFGNYLKSAYFTYGATSGHPATKRIGGIKHASGRYEPFNRW